MAKIEIKGWDKLEKQLKENCKMTDVAKVVKHNGSEMARKMVRNADFAMGYQTGTTKRSIILEIQDGGFTAVSGTIEPVINPETGQAATEYSPYVEYGTRFMSAQPFIRPAYNEQAAKFKSDMRKLVR